MLHWYLSCMFAYSILNLEILQQFRHISTLSFKEDNYDLAQTEAVVIICLV